jgi:aspartyl-tRNA(Asn)/glutamyl-tRNA(Gln) amidotransferase subunit C
MEIDKNTFQKIANLSKIKIADDKLEAMLSDFNKIMSYVDKVRELDTSSVSEEDVFEWSENKVRPDKIGKSLSRDEISDMAPKFENGYIVVPRVIET